MEKFNLNDLKKVYLSTTPSKRLADGGWLELVGKLEEPQRVSKFWFLQKRFVLLSVVILLVAMFSLAKVSEAAAPGDLLYPVKRIAEDIGVAVSGDRQAKVDARAKDIINTVERNKDQKTVEKATEEYKKTVTDTQNDVRKNPQEQEKFKENLKKQEQDFENTATHNPQAAEHLSEAIESSRRGQLNENVKGENSKENGGQGEDKVENRHGD